MFAWSLHFQERLESHVPHRNALGFLSFIITDLPPPPSIFLSLPLSPPFHSLLVIFPDCTCGSILIIKCRADTLQMSPGLWPVIPSLPSSVIFLVRAIGKLSAVTLSQSVCLSTHSLICSVGDWNRFLQMWRKCIVTEPHLQPLQNVLHYHTICGIFCPLTPSHYLRKQTKV